MSCPERRWSKKFRSAERRRRNHVNLHMRELCKDPEISILLASIKKTLRRKLHA